MQTRKDDRSLGELFGDLARDMGVLVRQEVGLATTEMTHKATRMARNVAVVAVGGLVASQLPEIQRYLKMRAM